VRKSFGLCSDERPIAAAATEMELVLAVPSDTTMSSTATSTHVSSSAHLCQPRIHRHGAAAMRTWLYKHGLSKSLHWHSRHPPVLNNSHIHHQH
jgi:hypothetical protein